MFGTKEWNEFYRAKYNSIYRKLITFLVHFENIMECNFKKWWNENSIISFQGNLIPLICEKFYTQQSEHNKF